MVLDFNFNLYNRGIVLILAINNQFVFATTNTWKIMYNLNSSYRVCNILCSIFIPSSVRKLDTI